jgi:hypothetical protein
MIKNIIMLYVLNYWVLIDCKIIAKKMDGFRSHIANNIIKTFQPRHKPFNFITRESDTVISM